MVLNQYMSNVETYNLRDVLMRARILRSNPLVPGNTALAELGDAPCDRVYWYCGCVDDMAFVGYWMSSDDSSQE